MITNCPVCGKAFDVLWPHLWKYKNGNSFICTWKCLRKIEKEAEEMEKMKKDGTPAKKPGPKPKKEFVAEKIWQAPEEADPFTIKLEAPEPKFEYKVTAIETTAGTFQYFKKAGYLDWTALDGGTISMNLEEWKEFFKIWPDVMRVLGVGDPHD